jgi:ABC-2 type transport system ATP-binding protein
MTLEVLNIHKHFKDKHVLKGVGFTVEAGQAMGYLGRNGAGKTTTIRILTNIFKPDGGEVLLDGNPIDHHKVRMGYLPEERGLYPKVKVGEQMTYIGRLRGMDAASAKKSAQRLLEELGAAEYWGKKLDTLSKGNQQKIQLAIAVLHDPDVVILDEPFSGLDPVNAQVLKDLISKEVNRGKIVLFSSHQMSYVEEFCSHICIINNGGIVLDGKVREIKKSFPRNKIAFVTEEATGFVDSEAMENASFKEMVNSITCDAETIIFDLKDARDKPKLVAALAAGEVGIESFKVVEPTLEDIFIAYTKDDVFTESQGYENIAGGMSGHVFNINEGGVVR